MTITCGKCGSHMYFDSGLDAYTCRLHCYCGWKGCPGRPATLSMNQYAGSAGALLHDECEEARNAL